MVIAVYMKHIGQYIEKFTEPFGRSQVMNVWIHCMHCKLTIYAFSD